MKAPGAPRIRRVVLEVVGWVLVVAGIAALVLPGPGLLMLFAGLVILSQEYEWAERRLEPIKSGALRAPPRASRPGSGSPCPPWRSA